MSFFGCSRIFKKICSHDKPVVNIINIFDGLMLHLLSNINLFEKLFSSHELVVTKFSVGFYQIQEMKKKTQERI